MRADITKELLIDKYYNGNKSMPEIAKDLGISTSYVKKLFGKYNIPSRQKPTVSKSRIAFCKRRRKGFKGITGTYWCAVKYHAKYRNMIISVDMEYVWWLYKKQKMRCALSGQKIFFPKNGSIKGRTYQTSSLDRIDSSIGYIAGNVQWVHKDINVMKQDWTEKEFIKICTLVARYNKCK